MFKVGDKVVLINNEDSRILVVDFAGWDTNLSVIGLSKYKDIRGYVWGKDLFRHATPEEIAAGHRIDTNTGVTVITPSGNSKVKGGLTAFVDMGDDSHIENHVSPNCKKFDERVNSNETK